MNSTDSSNIDKIESKMVEIFPKYKVRKAALFGSFARGDFTNDSDIDLIIDFKRDVEVSNYLYDLWDLLEEITERKVDIIPHRSYLVEVIPKLRDNISEDLRWFYVDSWL